MKFKKTILLASLALSCVVLGTNCYAEDRYDNTSPYKFISPNLTEEHNYNSQAEFQEAVKNSNLSFKEKLALLRKIKTIQDGYTLRTLRKEKELREARQSEINQKYQDIEKLIKDSQLSDSQREKFEDDLDGIKHDEGINKKTYLENLEEEIKSATKSR